MRCAFATLIACCYALIVDAWACGILLYEILTGRRPFCSDNELTQRQHEVGCASRRVCARALTLCRWPQPAEPAFAGPEQVEELFSRDRWRRRVPPPGAKELIVGLLEFNARARMNVDEALEHYFITGVSVVWSVCRATSQHPFSRTITVIHVNSGNDRRPIGLHRSPVRRDLNRLE